MATINKDTVQYLAKLSRIAVSEEEEEALVRDLEKIVQYVDELREVDTTNTAPCTYVAKSVDKTPLRKDEVERTLTSDDFFKCTPQQTARMVRVPPVLKGE